MFLIRTRDPFFHGFHRIRFQLDMFKLANQAEKCFETVTAFIEKVWDLENIKYLADLTRLTAAMTGDSCTGH